VKEDEDEDVVGERVEALGREGNGSGEAKLLTNVRRGVDTACAHNFFYRIK
jgi:hypothetical protein